VPMLSNGPRVDSTRVNGDCPANFGRGLFGFALTCPNPNTQSEWLLSPQLPNVSEQFSRKNDCNSLLRLSNHAAATQATLSSRRMTSGMGSQLFTICDEPAQKWDEPKVHPDSLPRSGASGRPQACLG